MAKEIKVGDLLKKAKRIDDSDKPQNQEKEKPVDPDFLRVWHGILGTAFTMIATKVVEWEVEHTTDHKLSTNIRAASRGIRALVAIYSNQYVPENYGLDQETYSQSLVNHLNASLQDNNMMHADLILQNALNAHPNKTLATLIDRDQLVKEFHYQIRHNIIQKAIQKLDAANRTNLAAQLILDPQPPAEKTPRRGLFGRRS